VLVGAGRALLVGVGLQQRAIHVHHQQLGVGMATGSPGPATGVGAGRAQAGKPVGVAGDLLNHPPCRGRGGDLTEQLGLVAQGGQVAEAVAAVGQQHRKVAQHSADLVAMPAGLTLAGPPAERGGQPQPVGQLAQQRRAGVADHTLAVGGDLKDRTWAGSLHPQGALLEWRMRP
jgi:hypothetical protein